MRKDEKYKLSEFGFSLIEVVIVTALMGLISLAVMQLTSNMNKSTVALKVKLDAMGLKNELITIMMSEENCTKALKDNDFNLSQAQLDSGQDVATFTLPNGTSYSVGSTILGSKLEIQRMAFKNALLIGPGPSDTKVYTTELSFRLTNKAGSGISDLYRKIGTFYITVKNTNSKITTCSSKLGVASLCADLGSGSTYNATTGKCDIVPAPKTCGGIGHGQTTSSCSGSGCSGSTGSYTHTTRLCLYGNFVTIGTSSGSNSPSCFIGSSLVRMQDGSLKRIDQIQVGDKVIGENSIINTVSSIEMPFLGTRKLHSLNDDNNYFVTAEHPLKTTKGWKSFDPEMTAIEHNFLVDEKPLAIGDALIRFHLIPVKLKKYFTKEDAPDTRLYNLLLKGNNTYFVNDYLVHNKNGGT